MHRYQHTQKSRITKNQVDMTPPTETNKAVVTDPKEIEICELSDKKFRVILLKKFSELQNTQKGKLTK